MIGLSIESTPFLGTYPTLLLLRPSPHRSRWTARARSINANLMPLPSSGIILAIPRDDDASKSLPTGESVGAAYRFGKVPYADDRGASRHEANTLPGGLQNLQQTFRFYRVTATRGGYQDAPLRGYCCILRLNSTCLDPRRTLTGIRSPAGRLTSFANRSDSRIRFECPAIETITSPFKKPWFLACA
jgi:hypothetical protein